MLDAVQAYLDAEPKIDLMLVVGTSAVVYPAAGYVNIAKKMGARAAVVNMDPWHKRTSELGPEDWYFHGDANELVPDMLRDVIGEVA